MDNASKLNRLIEGAEELLTKLADNRNPEIQELRERVDKAIDEAQRAIYHDDDQDDVGIRDIWTSVDDYVSNYSWLALVTGVLFAGTLGFLVGSTVGAKRRAYPARERGAPAD